MIKMIKMIKTISHSVEQKSESSMLDLLLPTLPYVHINSNDPPGRVGQVIVFVLVLIYYYVFVFTSVTS